MKIGLRTPNPKKSLRAMTTGKANRKAKKEINPLYGTKGIGFAKNPTKSIKNAAYKKTTFSIMDIFKKLF